jgi:hypothetical protein
LISYLKIEIDEKMTWSSLAQKIRGDIEIEHEVGELCHFYVIGPRLPREELFIYAASADREWPRSSRLGRQFIHYISSSSDDAHSIFRRMDSTDHNWRLMVVFQDPKTAPVDGWDARNALAMLTMSIPWGRLPVWRCVDNAQITLNAQWTSYSIDPIARRLVIPPLVLGYISDDDIRIQSASLLQYRQLSIKQVTLSCCDIRGDGFIKEIFRVVLSLDDTWQSLFSHFRPRWHNGYQCKVWLAPTRIMHPSMAHKFNRLVSLAMDAQSSFGSIGLIEIPNIANRLDKKMSMTMTYGMHVYIIYVWAPASPITFMKNIRYHIECLSECIDLGDFEQIDMEMFARIAVTCVCMISHSVMPFTWKNSSFKVISESEVKRIDDIIQNKTCPWGVSWDEFLSGETLLGEIMRNRARYCVDQAPRGTHSWRPWYRGADLWHIDIHEMVTGDEPMPDRSLIGVPPVITPVEEEGDDQPPE